MELKPGYKQTEVGVIPEDWGVVNAFEACLKIQDGTHFSPKPGGVSEYLYITSKNIRFGYLDISSASRINVEQHRSIYKRCDVKKGDLLLTKDGANTGNAAVNTLDGEFSLLSSVAFLRFDESMHSSGYFLQQFLSPSCQRQVQDAMAGNAITRLTLGKIKKLKFPIPPTKTEQHAIAEVLSDTDALIASLEQLIAKKRQIKQGAMQELLTGRKRLPDFTGEWVVKRLGDVAEIKTGICNNQDKIEDGKYPFFVRSATVERINDYSYECEAILIPGEGGIGSIFHYIIGRFALHQRVYAITQFSEETAGKYILYYLAKFFGFHAMQNSVKATVDSLRLPTFQNFEMLIPSKMEEQTAITSVLSDMDADLAAFEKRLDKTRQIKQGMMQNLLTGKIRLV